MWPSSLSSVHPIGRRRFYRDGDGHVWCFTAGSAAVPVAAWRLATLCDLRMPEVTPWDMGGGGWLMRLEPDLRALDRASSLREGLTPDEAGQMLQNAVLDMLMANRDGHTGTLMRDADGHIWSIDRSRAWDGSGFLPAARRWFDEAVLYPGMLDRTTPEPMIDTLEAIEDISTERFERIIEPVVAEWQALGRRSRAAFMAEVIEAKVGLGGTMRGFVAERLRAVAEAGHAVPRPWLGWVR